MENLQGLERFKGSESMFRLTKISSKRAGSQVAVGQSVTGDFDLYVYPKSLTITDKVGVVVEGFGFNYLRTSPIVKVVDVTEKTTVFETEGAVYKLEQLEQV